MRRRGALRRGVLPQDIEGNNFERALVRRGQGDGGADASLQTLEPPGCADAPAIAGVQSGKIILRPWRAEVVADRAAIFEKFVGDFDTYRVAADILGTGVAMPVAKITGDGRQRTRLEWSAENVA